MNNQNNHSDGIFNIRYDVLICLFLVIATLAVYWQINYHEFINLDDSLYVLQNKDVQKGLTSESISWAFSFTDIAYWHPLTWLSHMLDCQIYGLIPGMHHRTSLIFHIVNSILLFFVLQKMTGALWQSAFVAALFALHPVNVESVAWVAERKNVLSTFFWMLTMLAYVHYTTRPSLYRYLLTLLFLMLGLMAKPMLVTLPFVLLLLDYWPLERLRHQSPFNLILEKIPFFALSAVSVYISSLSVHRYEIVVSMESVPMQLRIANALVSYVKYIEKMIWPKNLAIFYPFPDTLPIWQILGAGLFLASISFLVLLNLRKKPYLCMGWLWFLGTLIPVIGLKQAGLWPSMADRWAYVPLVGIFIILAWGGSDLLKKWTHKKIMLTILAIAVILALTVLSFMQASHWKNSITLFENAIKVTKNNCMAHNNLGITLFEKGEFNKAIFHYKKALNIKPDTSEAIKNLGVALTKKGNLKEAARYFSKALVINSENWDSHYKLGDVLAKRGKFNKAIRHFEEVIRINPGYAPAYNEIGIILAQKGKLQKSNDFFSKAIQLEPDCKEARDNLLILKQLMQHDEK
ncbi:MAG: tetratricopeptide repeat protein [Bacteroidales bacterium]|nr:tetratricopeptide repeat protein [Bacteroidales bacterium]